MDVVGIIANFAGVISLAMKLAGILDRAIENARTADEKVRLIAKNLRATAYSLTTVQTLLKKDLLASGDRLFTDEDCRHIVPLVQQCRSILGKITDSFKSMGRVEVLDAVTEDQCKLENGSTAVIPHNTAVFKFSIWGRMRWLRKSPMILQSIADLDQSMNSLRTIVVLADVARQNRRWQKERETKREEKTDRAAWKKWKWVGLLRRRWNSFAPSHHHRKRTAHLVEANQQLCIEAAPAEDIFTLARQESLVSGRLIDFPFGPVHRKGLR